MWKNADLHTIQTKKRSSRITDTDSSVKISNNGMQEKQFYAEFTDKIIDLVLKEYPTSDEQASVLCSKVMYIIEQHIINNLHPFSTRTEINAMISKVNFSYDVAVQELMKLNKPLLKPGAVKSIFMLY